MDEIEISRIIRTSRRSVAVRITPQATVEVLAPRLMPDWLVKTTIRDQEDWIKKKLNEMKKKGSVVRTRYFEEGEIFPYIGRNYPLVIQHVAKKPLELSHAFVMSQTHKHRARELFEKWYRKEAKIVLTERTSYYADLFDIDFTGIKINSAKSQWGSCGSQGNLSFTWRLVMAPLKAIDYVVAHELAHRTHMNHSKAFWSRVEELFPEYKVQRRWFKTFGHTLWW